MSETLTASAERVNQVPITDDVLNVADFNNRIVGAYNGSNAREVLLVPEQWEQMKASQATSLSA